MRLILAIAALLATTGQILGDGADELPPMDYAKPTFTDARGCVYVRAEMGGWTLWVQRLTEAGQPDCSGARTGQSNALSA